MEGTIEDGEVDRRELASSSFHLVVWIQSRCGVVGIEVSRLFYGFGNGADPTVLILLLRFQSRESQKSSPWPKR